ncbi:hypothetical protein LNKW23_37180 [Paralimibaculum aggregatum]|uniref:HTH marR-type domain-containing protein n=1 Tax=Paralimibaculum aggregatum TaxID=3036245 RepID=A0ABQ6LQU7_9RHOB|nr:MarR family transcriptional regulator [Limibaculum sp. NKW23]GMG84502.1 hypothetical protein LNKW23_37180 [Limibaculum sp. NKW23]
MQVDRHGFHGLLHSANLVEAELRRQLAPLGIQTRQALVLDAMDRMGPVSQSVLAAEFGVTSASMSTMTDRLLAAGYITRTTSPTSRRQNELELTPRGRALLDGIAQAWTAVDRILTKALGDDAASFFAQAQRLRNALEGKIPGRN